MKKLLLVGAIALAYINGVAQNTSIKKEMAKFEPETNNVLVMIGQDLHAVGGHDNYSNGYCDFFDVPGGVTFYTNFSPGDESYGHYNRGNDGITTIDNWGAGDSSGQLYVDNPKFEHAVFAIGLSLVNHEKQVAKGKHDQLIKDLALWIKSTNRPVFLRIGYEFDGWDWNHYQKKFYLKSWERIHTIFNELEVDNVAFVWQSKGTGSDQDVLEEWYPGDKLVDWVGYSYFGSPDEEMLKFARTHNKPVFIAEATPVLEEDGLFFEARLSKPEIAKRMWNEWFIGFFNTINQNRDVIKAFSYINEDWPSQPMWLTNPVFKDVDSRLQMSDYVSDLWRKELSKSYYLKANDSLFKRLGYHKN